MTNAGGASLCIAINSAQQSLNSSSVATLSRNSPYIWSNTVQHRGQSSTTIDARSNDRLDYSAAITSIAAQRANDLWTYICDWSRPHLLTHRLATYHAGPALNLATLEGLQDTLITEIAAI